MRFNVLDLAAQVRRAFNADACAQFNRRLDGGMIFSSIAELLGAVPTPTPSSTPTPSLSPRSGEVASTATSPWWLILVACIALLGVLTTACIQWWIGRRTSAALTASADAARENAAAVRMSAEASIKSAEAALQSAAASEESVRTNARIAEDAGKRADAVALSQRYQDAASQLGSESAATRSAGVYAMARLADDWLEQRQVCVDVLCAYLRTDASHDSRLGEDQVRETIQSVMGNHFLPEHPSSWCALTIDLHGATFKDLDWSGAAFAKRPTLAGCIFEGSCHFDRVNFEAGADMDGIKVRDGLLRIEDVALGERLSLRESIVASNASIVIFLSKVNDHGRLELQGTTIAGALLLLLERHRTEVPYDLTGLALDANAKLRISQATSERPGNLPRVSIRSASIGSSSEVEIDQDLIDSGKVKWWPASTARDVKLNFSQREP